MGRRGTPIWLMGMTDATFGMYAGLVAISLPELLAEQGLPEAKIAVLTATAMSPLFWVFVVCPMLDVRFTRRTYALVSAVVAVVLMSAGLMSLRHTTTMVALLMLGFACATINQNALGGWLSTVIRREDESRLSAWFNVANIGGSGVTGMCVLELMHHLPLVVAVGILSAMLLLPLAIYPLIELTLPDGRLAKESYEDFFRDVLALLKRREILIAMALFAAPCSGFALTNVLGGMADRDFHASARVIALAGGVGVVVAGIGGSLIFPVLAKRVALRPLYLWIGVVGASFTLSLLLLPRTPAMFAVAMVGENVFQALGLTGVYAISFETIGQKNPLAATTFSVLGAACNLPIIYMQIVDGRAYGWRGVPGSFLVDAGLGILACGLMGLMLRAVTRSKLSGTLKMSV